MLNHNIISKLLLYIKILHQRNFQYCPINCTLKFSLKSMGSACAISNLYKSCSWDICLKSFSIKIWRKNNSLQIFWQNGFFFHQGKTFIFESLMGKMADFLDVISPVYIDHFTFVGIYMYLNTFNYNNVNGFKTIVQYHILQFTLIPKIN